MKKAWWKEAVVYQIYPRSFMDSNGDGIGDLRGVISRLDYLQYLGIDVIWLSPIYKSPNDDNGYDISDYRDIMTEFGTLADFDEMLAEAHKRGIRIMMDLVVNHTSDEHPWFVESRKSVDNPYRDYYIWRAPRDGKEPNNWGACFGGPAWEYDAQTQMYYLHLFSKKQPDLNWKNETVRNEVYDLMTWWCEKGVDGFRMDVINAIFKEDEMPDGETNGGKYGDFGPYCMNRPHVHEYLQEMNVRVLSHYDLITVGETAGVTPEQAKHYAGEDTHELNMVFQFDHVDGDGKYGKWTDERVALPPLKQTMSKWQTQLEGQAWNSLYWDNHDQPRAVSRFGDDRPKWRDRSAKMIATCLHMMQGTPYIYQGEELGMTNYPFTQLSEFRDIESIHAYRDWVEEGPLTHEQFWPCLAHKSRDNARTPMQWTDEANAGFTTGTPWIGVNPNYTQINAQAETADPDSVFHYYRKLIALRKQYDIIVYGDFELMLPDDENIFAYTRSYEGQQLLVVCNYSDVGQNFIIPEVFANASPLITNCTREMYAGEVTLEPYETFVLLNKLQ